MRQIWFAALIGGFVVQSQALTPKVLLIGVDGLRADAMIAANTPNIDSLIANGCWTDRANASEVTVSGPGWSNILCGVWPDRHGVSNNNFTGSNYGTYPHFFARLKQARPSLVTAHYVSWQPLDSNILGTTGANHRRYIDYNSDGDRLLTNAAAALLVQSNPDVMFFYFSDVDTAGHNSGFHPSVPEYISEIEQVDGQVGSLLTAIRLRPTYALEDWLIILVTDHGGTLDHSHGRNESAHRHIPFIVSGPSAAKGRLYDTVNQPDAVATAAAHLGISVSSAWGWDGRAVGLKKATFPYGTNLLYNGDAERQSGYGAATSNRGIAGWEDWSDFTLLNYGVNGYPNTSTPGPSNRALNFFTANTSQTTTISQAIDLSMIGGKIDGGGLSYELSGWLGGYATQRDQILLSVVFLDGEYREVGKAEIAPVTKEARGGVTSLLYRSTSDRIPTGTRVAKVVVTAEREAGTATDGYADNLAFKVLAP